MIKVNYQNLHSFTNKQFDYFHDFKTDEAKFVDGETWEIINQSRYSSFFTEEKAPCCAKFYKVFY